MVVKNREHVGLLRLLVSPILSPQTLRIVLNSDELFFENLKQKKDVIYDDQRGRFIFTRNNRSVGFFVDNFTSTAESYFPSKKTLTDFSL